MRRTSTPSKTNPRNRPATQADVRRAWEKGVDEGCTIACAIMLTVLADKFDGKDYIPDIWREVNKLSDEIKEKRVSVSDLRRVLLNEYGVEV